MENPSQSQCTKVGRVMSGWKWGWRGAVVGVERRYEACGCVGVVMWSGRGWRERQRRLRRVWFSTDPATHCRCDRVRRVSASRWNDSRSYLSICNGLLEQNDCSSWKNWIKHRRSLVCGTGQAIADLRRLWCSGEETISKSNLGIMEDQLWRNKSSWNWFHRC